MKTTFNSIGLLTAIIIFFMLFFPAISCSQMNSDLKSTLTNGIELLENKKYKTFISEFIPPKKLEQITNQVSIEFYAEKIFKKKRAIHMLSGFKAALGKKPIMSEDGNHARHEYEASDDITFKHLRSNGENSFISFVKKENRWYVNDYSLPKKK